MPVTDPAESWKYALALASAPTLPPEIGQLVWFHLLHELGILDDEEYRGAKSKVLAKPPTPNPSPQPPPNEQQQQQQPPGAPGQKGK